MKPSFNANPCNALLKGLEEAVFFSIQEDGFLYRSGGVHSCVSDFKRMQSTKPVLNSSVKLPADGGIGLWGAYPTPAFHLQVPWAQPTDFVL